MADHSLINRTHDLFFGIGRSPSVHRRRSSCFTGEKRTVPWLIGLETRSDLAVALFDRFKIEIFLNDHSAISFQQPKDIVEGCVD